MFFFFDFASPIVTKKEYVVIKRGSRSVRFPVAHILAAIRSANETFEKYSQVNNELDLFQILGMRNLSSFVGEVFVACLRNVAKGLLGKNPHQDGYPDLLLLDGYGKAIYDRITNKQDKAPFSPFVGGGIEVKATCGAVPTPSACEKLKIKKPEVGDTRTELLRGYDWKAHHRKTNNLIGLLWDFKDRVPFITAVFYSSDLKVSDWGEIVQPREGGGRTTSVSVMTRDGVRKMARGCLYCVNNDSLIEFLNKHNDVDVRKLLVKQL